MSTDTFAFIEQSKRKEIYEVFLECEKTGKNYLSALETVFFLNNTSLDTDREPLELSVINDIFSNVVNQISDIGRGVSYGSK